LLNSKTTGDELSKFSHDKSSLSLFCLFIQKKLCPDVSMEDLMLIAEYIDIDRDGFIGKEDIETFLSRSNIISSHQIHDAGLPLFPTEALSESEVLKLLKELKSAMESRHLKIHDLFVKLDTNEDGFISYDELSKGLDGLVSLP
jgi:Ca2+-binding EF-hand superfamily protein